MSDFDTGGQPAGIGGWLILVAIGVIIAPLQVIYFTVQTFPPIFRDGTYAGLTGPASAYYHPLWGPLILGEIAVNLVLIGLFALQLVLFFRKHWRFPRLFIFLRIAVIVVTLIDGYLLTIILPDVPMFDAETTRDLMRNVIAAAIWVPYMLMSKRVKATFIVGAPPGSRDDIAERFT